MLYLNASEVAAAAGLNPYCTPEKIFKKYLKPQDAKNDEYAKANAVMEQVVSQIGDEELKEKFSKIQTEDELTEFSEQVIAKISEPIVNRAFADERNEGYQELLDKLGKEVYDNVKTSLKSKVNTSLGTKDEESILNNLEMRTNTVITRRNDKMYYTTFNFNDFAIKVGGRIDGFDEENGTLVEVKRRTRRFLGLPKYNKVQCELYMRMLDLSKCTVTEMFDGETKDHEYVSDPELLNEITEGLEKYGQLF